MCKFVYGFSTGIPLNILIIYGKDPNFKAPKFHFNMRVYDCNQYVKKN